MKVLSVTGKESGRTATIKNIVKEIRHRGFSVGYIKEIDYKGISPDTGIYRQNITGPEIIAVRGHKETEILYPEKLPVEDILKHYTQDYVIIEGITDFNSPIILCVNNTADIRNHRDRDYFNRVFMISGMIRNSEEKTFREIPIINPEINTMQMADIIIEKVFDMLPDFSPECCSACGFDCRKLCARILKGQSERPDCKIEEAGIMLSIDGKKINMVPFVQNIIRDTIMAMAGNLRGCRNGKRIEITINKQFSG